MCLFYATCRKHTQAAESLNCAKMTIDTKTIYNCAPVEQNQSDTIIILKVMHYHFKNDCCVYLDSSFLLLCLERFVLKL